MAEIIFYGIILGVILAVVPFTHSFGIFILTIVGIIFIETLLALILGGIFKVLMPLIIVVLVIALIYHLATRNKLK